MQSVGSDERPSSLEGESRVSVAIVGAGAIGATLGDALSQHARLFLCRRTSAPVSVSLSGQEHQIHGAVWAGAEEAQPVDWVVVATKAQDTETIGPWLERLVTPRTRIVMAQNGIDHASRVAAWVPASRVTPAVVYAAAERMDENHVTIHDYGSLALPETTAARQFAALFSDLVDIRIGTDFESASWRKLIMNSAISSVTALTSQTVSVRDVPMIGGLLRELLLEGIAVARATGVPISLGESIAMFARIAHIPPAHRTSLEVDVSRGRPSEYQFLSGALLGHARQHGIAAPRLETVHALLSGRQ